MPLTDTAIRKIKSADKAYKLPDEKGLYLFITVPGGKLWRFNYRHDGKQKTLSFGAYPDVPLIRAREKRDEARRLLADGVDPGEHRKVQKAAKVALLANSFEAIGREWFTKMKPEWVDSHADKILARLERDVFPWLGKPHCRTDSRGSPDDTQTNQRPGRERHGKASATGLRWCVPLCDPDGPRQLQPDS